MRASPNPVSLDLDPVPSKPDQVAADPVMTEGVIEADVTLLEGDLDPGLTAGAADTPSTRAAADVKVGTIEGRTETTDLEMNIETEGRIEEDQVIEVEGQDPEIEKEEIHQKQVIRKRISAKRS